MLNLDISGIDQNHQNMGGGIDAAGRSMIDSIIFEFQDYVGRRSSSAPRKSKERKDEELKELSQPLPADKKSN